MDNKDPKSPATTSQAYDVMVSRWQLVEDLLGGTEAMRLAGERHLPRHPEETDQGYDARLQQAVLYNVFEETLDNMSSKPFSEELKVNDDVPEPVLELLDDVDLQGNKLHVFARSWFREGLAKGFAHVLIDAPRPTERPDGQPRTLDDDRREGIRPYWVLVKPENVLFFRTEVIGGVEIPAHVRILSYRVEQVGFAEVHKKQIQVLEPGFVTVYEPKPRQNSTQKEEWVQVDAWSTGLDYIPIFTFYASEKDACCLARLPLETLAYLNVTHWQSTADQRHILGVARFPILACSGASSDDSDPVIIGPNKVLYNEDPAGKFYYVEHQGTSITAGREDLADLEEKMAGFGSEFLKDRPGDSTATAKALDTAEANSDLAQIVGKFCDVVAQALTATALWIRAGDNGGTIELVKDYSVAHVDDSGLAALAAARASRDISRLAYLEGLKLRGVLPEDFDPDEDEEELQAELDKIMAAGGTNDDLNPDGNKLEKE